MFQERGLTIFLDLDGTQNSGRQLGPISLPLFSLGTAYELLIGRLSLPSTGVALKEARVKGNWKEALNTWFHTNRSLTKDSELGLADLVTLREAFRGRSISIETLSGRQPYLHSLTREQLEARIAAGYINGIRLNTSDSSSGFKEDEVIKEVKKGRNVVLVEDDAEAGLRVARVQEVCEEGQRVEVMMLDNLSNSDWLLSHAGIILPGNITRVPSFTHAAYVIRNKVFGGQL